MAFSDVNICNLALAKLGDEASVTSIDPSDSSTQGDYCAIFFPFVKEYILNYHDWSFATRRETLSNITNPITEWKYAHSVPADFARIMAVRPNGGNPIDQYSLEVLSTGAYVLYTDYETVELQYQANISNSIYPASFVEAMTTMLAAYLAGPILKGDVGAAAAAKFEERLVGKLAFAVNLDCRNSKQRGSYIPASVATINGIIPDGVSQELTGSVTYPPAGFTVS